jgi:hypothetical protein
MLDIQNMYQPLAQLQKKSRSLCGMVPLRGTPRAASTEACGAEKGAVRTRRRMAMRKGAKCRQRARARRRTERRRMRMRRR